MFIYIYNVDRYRDRDRDREREQEIKQELHNIYLWYYPCFLLKGCPASKAGPSFSCKPGTGHFLPVKTPVHGCFIWSAKVKPRYMNDTHKGCNVVASSISVPRGQSRFQENFFMFHLTPLQAQDITMSRWVGTYMHSHCVYVAKLLSGTWLSLRKLFFKPSLQA